MGETGVTGVNAIRLEPVYIKSIWAGERLQRIRGLKERGYGICREVCAYDKSENRVYGGEWDGCSIRQVIDERHQWLMGDDESDQLIRVAYMDTAQDLSIQVHPNEEQAEAVEDYEKSESWYIVESDPGAYITAGITLQDKEKVREAIAENQLENYLTRIPVEKGDFVMIPAGMVHACGKNMLVLEIGSFGGITYRLYDYGRGRDLDLEKGLEVLDPSMVCEVNHLQQKEYNVKRNIVRHSVFCVDLIDVKNRWEMTAGSHYHVFICVEGKCEILIDEERYSLSYTDTILIPAACSEVVVIGMARLLISHRP